MNYIIIIDNDSVQAQLLKELLNVEKNKKNYANYIIGAWYGFDYAQGDIDIAIKTQELCGLLEELLNNGDSNIKLLIDMLIEQHEENPHTNFIDELHYNPNLTNIKIASGIRIANIILDTLVAYQERIEISFMSQWLNLQNEETLEGYNGIHNNPQWNNRKIQHVLKPCSENKLIDMELPMPKYGAKTITKAFCNVAFEKFEGEKND